MRAAAGFFPVPDSGPRSTTESLEEKEWTVSTSSQAPPPLSTTSAFKQLAMAINPNIPADQASNLMHDFRNAVRAEDFVRQGKASDTLTWGQAVYIARDGLCSCSGGLKPCDMGGAA
jgi:hypothetical protein